MPSPSREWRLQNWRTLPTLRPSEVAVVTGLAVGHIRKLIASRELPVHRVGTAVLVPVQAVLALVGEAPAENTALPPAAPGIDRWAQKTADRVFRKIRDSA